MKTEQNLLEILQNAERRVYQSSVKRKIIPKVKNTIIMQDPWLSNSVSESYAKLTGIHAAAYRGDLESLKLELNKGNQGENANKRCDVFGRSPLQHAVNGLQKAVNNKDLAVQHQYEECIAELLPHTFATKHPYSSAIESLPNKAVSNFLANIFSDKLESIIHDIAEIGNTKLLAMLLSMGKNVDQVRGGYDKSETPLMRAAGREGNEECLRFLLENKAQIDTKTFYDETSPHRNSECGETALFRAAAVGAIGNVKLLLSRNANPNIKTNWNRTPFHAAAERYRGGNIADTLACLQEFLNLKADINAGHFCSYYPFPNTHNITALHSAAINDSPEIVTFLLENKANPHVMTDKKYTPLLLAVYQDQQASVMRLLDGKADINFRDANSTPLHTAAINGHKEMATLLVAKGADVNAKFRSNFIHRRGVVFTAIEYIDHSRAKIDKKAVKQHLEILAALQPTLVMFGMSEDLKCFAETIRNEFDKLKHSSSDIVLELGKRTLISLLGSQLLEWINKNEKVFFEALDKLKEKAVTLEDVLFVMLQGIELILQERADLKQIVDQLLECQEKLQLRLQTTKDYNSIECFSDFSNIKASDRGDIRAAVDTNAALVQKKTVSSHAPLERKTTVESDAPGDSKATVDQVAADANVSNTTQNLPTVAKPTEPSVSEPRASTLTAFEQHCQATSDTNASVNAPANANLTLTSEDGDASKVDSFAVSDSCVIS